ncbi:MAG: hypothetical protein CME70_23705 [Halobacteriovorax sp.]|nr:hypothetical protein [Halobacteriovorax sp.]|tara:strand:- start:96570 stop:99479 length:2910 start_codon:yes stop_codon:yes gene_type:complete
MRQFILILGLVCSFAISAKEYKWVQKTSNGIKFALAYEQEGSWILDEFHAPKGEFQQKLSSRRFENIELLKKALINYKLVNRIDYKSPDDSDEKARNKRIWKATNKWNQEWERKYATWIRETLHTDFFVDYGIETDCADVIVGLRWIFSRINKLPAGNTLAGTDKVFTNEHMLRSWKKLETDPIWHKDKLFMTALNYLMDNTYTHSVWDDSYPLKISSDSLIEGTFYLNLEDVSGHVRIVAKTSYNSLTSVPLIMRASTVPRGLRRLSEEVFLNFEKPEASTSGFRAMRWPEGKGKKLKLKKDSTHPSFGNNQYDDDFVGEGESFALGVFKAVRPDFSVEQLIKEGLGDIGEALELRKSVVEEGFSACQLIDCSPGTDAYEAYSTPSRDSKIQKLFHSLEKLVKSLKVVLPGLEKSWEEALSKKTVEVLGKSLNMKQARYMFKEGQYSFDPRHSLEARWSTSSIGLAELVKAKLEKLLKEREERINERGTCEQDCFPKGGWYWDGNTFELDAKIAQVNYLVRNFCNVFESGNCQNDLDIDLNEKRVLANGENNSLLYWQDKIPFFNSDPRVAKNYNWGESLSNAFHLPAFKNLEITDNAVAVIDYKKVVNLPTGAKISIPESEFTSLNKKGLGFIQNGKVLTAISETGELGSTLLLENAPKLLKSYWKNSLGVLVGEEETLIIERRAEGLLLNLRDTRKLEVLSPTMFAFLETENNSILVITDNRAAQFDLGKDRLWSWTYVGQDDKEAVIAGVNGDGEAGFKILNLQTGEISWRDGDEISIHSNLGNGLWIYTENDDLKLGSLNGEEVLFKGEGVFLEQNGEYITLYKDNESLAYKLNRGLTRIEAPARSRELSGTAGPYLGWTNSENMVELFKANGSKIGAISQGVEVQSTSKWANFEFNSSHGKFEGNGGLLRPQGPGVALPEMTFLKSVHKKDEDSKYLKINRLKILERGILIQTYPGMYSWLEL